MTQRECLVFPPPHLFSLVTLTCLTLFDFHLSGYLKDAVCRIKSAPLEELREGVEESCAAITIQKLVGVCHVAELRSAYMLTLNSSNTRPSSTWVTSHSFSAHQITTSRKLCRKHFFLLHIKV
jgi:hypothetical protein